MKLTNSKLLREQLKNNLRNIKFKRKLVYHENISKTDQEVTDTDINTVLYLSNCKDSTVAIVNKCLKIVIHGCTNCIIGVEREPTTSVVELVNCQNVILAVSPKIEIRTVQVDKSDKILVNYRTKIPETAIYVSQTTHLYVGNRTIGQHTVVYPKLSLEQALHAVGNVTQQYLVTFDAKTGKALTFRIARGRNGSISVVK